MIEIHIIDYGIGNLRSIQKGLEKAGADAIITNSLEKIEDSNAIVLPGVGAFKDAMENLKECGFLDLLPKKVSEGAPILGICLGLQLFFDTSYEGGTHQGLGIIPGEVVRFPSVPGIKIPHMGWNSLAFKKSDHFLLEGIKEGTFFYFVHSFHAKTSEEHIVATSDYIHEFPAIVKNKKGNVAATQFHPEKSSKQGIKMLQNFIKFCKK
ncbi:MAG: imidazole glycerol phosphate synthase subunit HisH [Promethearchaeota archaeon]